MAVNIRNINWDWSIDINLKKSNMKNVFLLPTDKPSRLCYVIDTEKSALTLFEDEVEKSKRFFPEHIYITDDEDVKEGDWYYLPRTNSVHKCVEDPTELN